MTAKEMFEKLVYKSEFNNKYHIRYYNVKKDNYIWFDLQSKTLEISEYCNLKELQAINKQVEELWGDDLLKNNGSK